MKMINENKLWIILKEDPNKNDENQWIKKNMSLLVS